MNQVDAQLPAQRQHSILQLLSQKGQVLASELSQMFNVSEDTVRRDLRELAKQGKVKRVHGGAVLIAVDAGHEYQDRQDHNRATKTTLAQVAVSLLQPKQVIILDAGTSNLHIAQQLPLGMELTVVTNCPQIAIASSQHPTVKVIMSGGELHHSMQALTGMGAIETFHRINADLCFIGVCSINQKFGICTNNDAEAHVKRAMMASAAESVAMVTADKLGTVEPYKFADVTQLNYLITEVDAEESQLAPFKDSSLTILTP